MEKKGKEEVRTRKFKSLKAIEINVMHFLTAVVVLRVL